MNCYVSDCVGLRGYYGVAVGVVLVVSDLH